MTYETIYDLSAVRLLKVFYFYSWETFLLLDTFFFLSLRTAYCGGRGMARKCAVGVLLFTHLTIRSARLTDTLLWEAEAI